MPSQIIIIIIIIIIKIIIIIIIKDIGIWEREERTPYMPWKEKIRTQQNENVNNILHQL